MTRIYGRERTGSTCGERAGCSPRQAQCTACRGWSAVRWRSKRTMKRTHGWERICPCCAKRVGCSLRHALRAVSASPVRGW